AFFADNQPLIAQIVQRLTDDGSADTKQSTQLRFTRQLVPRLPNACLNACLDDIAQLSVIRKRARAIDLEFQNGSCPLVITSICSYYRQYTGVMQRVASELELTWS